MADPYERQDLQSYNPYPTGNVPPDAAGGLPNPYAGRGGDYMQPPPTPPPPKNWQEQAWNEIYPATQGQVHGGDYGDTSMGELSNQAAQAARATDARDKWTAWEKSPYRTRFPDAPDPATAMQMRNQRVTPPDISRLTYMPGAPPDVLLDSQSGDMYRYQTGGRVYYAGNVTLPQVDELTRAGAAVVGGLRQRGMLGDPVPHPLKSDHSWQSETSGKVPGEDVVMGINRNGPSLDDVGQFLSNQSGTIWAQRNEGPRRAAALGAVLSLPLAGAASGLFAPVALGGVGLAGEGAGAVAAGIGAGAAAGGLGMLAGQVAGERGDLSKVDWTAIARSVLASGAGSAVGQGVGALTSGLGAPSAVASGAGALSSKITSQGVGSLFPTRPVNITAFQPYPGMSPEAAQQIMTRTGY